MTKLVQDPMLKIQNLSAVEVERIEPLDIIRLLRIIWHGKILIILTTLFAVTAAGYYAFAVAQPRFAATTTLQIAPSNEKSLGPEPSLTGWPTDQSGLKTEIAILQSRHLLAMVVDEMGLLDDPVFNRYLTPVPQWSITGIRNTLRGVFSGTVESDPDDAAIHDKTIDNLARTIAVEPVRDTLILRITATTGDRKTSTQVADTLAALYLVDQVTAAQTATEQTFDWLSARVYDLQLDLEVKETAINDLITTNRANDATVLEALSRQSIETSDRLNDVEQALKIAEEKLARFDANLTSAALTEGTSRERLEAEVKRYADQASALAMFQQDTQTRLAGQSANLVRLQQLRRETDATRVLYETFLARMQETSVQRGLQKVDSRILTHATPGTYVAPRKVLILIMAAIAGATIGVLLVLSRQVFRKGFTSADSLIDATDLPVFAQIPRLSFRKPSKMLDYLERKPASAAAESMRNLRTSLLLSDTSSVPQVVLSTSSVAGEGKTTQSIGLAHNLGRLRKSVLLIEADARQPAFAKYFNSIGSDLSQVISGTMDLKGAIIRDARLAVDILPVRPGVQNPADQFSGPDFSAFIKKLRDRYDIIIIDAPPVLPVPDARILAQHCDAILYAVRWEKTDKRLLLAGKRALEDVNAKITGLVMTQVDIKRMRRYGEAHLSAYGDVYYQN